jgi:hypothetical protein
MNTMNIRAKLTGANLDCVGRRVCQYRGWQLSNKDSGSEVYRSIGQRLVHSVVDGGEDIIWGGRSAHCDCYSCVIVQWSESPWVGVRPEVERG